MEKDKQYHFATGFLISLLCGFVFGTLNGLYSAMLAGVAKEIYDYYDYGKPDFMDCLATWVGGVAGYIVAFFVHGV